MNRVRREGSGEEGEGGRKKRGEGWGRLAEFKMSRLGGRERREGGREGGRERGREGEREGGRGGREGEGGKEGVRREGGKEGEKGEREGGGRRLAV